MAFRSWKKVWVAPCFQPQRKAFFNSVRAPQRKKFVGSGLRAGEQTNPWFGSDYAKTEFAVRYAKQLQQERPDLVGRPFLDAISAEVRDTFGASK
jgi:hypothetical protein